MDEGESWGNAERDLVGGRVREENVPHATFYFTIGDINNFEDRLEAAQAERGVASRDFVPVQFVHERSWLGEVPTPTSRLSASGHHICAHDGVSRPRRRAGSCRRCC